MLELTRTTIEVKLDGKEYTLRMPTYKEGILYKHEIKLLQDDDVKASERLVEYLSKLGLPKEVSESLEIGHLEQVLEFILGAKKK